MEVFLQVFNHLKKAKNANPICRCLVLFTGSKSSLLQVPASMSHSQSEWECAVQKACSKSRGFNCPGKLQLVVPGTEFDILGILSCLNFSNCISRPYDC